MHLCTFSALFQPTFENSLRFGYRPGWYRENYFAPPSAHLLQQFARMPRLLSTLFCPSRRSLTRMRQKRRAESLGPINSELCRRAAGMLFLSKQSRSKHIHSEYHCCFTYLTTSCLENTVRCMQERLTDGELSVSFFSTASNFIHHTRLAHSAYPARGTLPSMAISLYQS